MRQRLVEKTRITSLGHRGVIFVLEVYEPYAHGRQDISNPNSRYSVIVRRFDSLWTHVYKRDNLTAKEAFDDLPCYIYEQWGYDINNYISGNIIDNIWFEKHLWEHQREIEEKEGKLTLPYQRWNRKLGQGYPLAKASELRILSATK